MKALSCEHEGGNDSRERQADSVSSGMLQLGPQEGTLSSTKLPSELYRLQRIVWPLEWHHTAGPGEHTGSVISVSVFYKRKK